MTGGSSSPSSIRSMNREKGQEVRDKGVGTKRQRIRLILLRLIASALSPLIPDTTCQTLDAPRILVIRPDHLGDLLFTTPALRFLRMALPGAHITCLVGPWARSVVENNPHVDQVLTCAFPGFTRRPKPSFLHPYSLLWRYAQELRVVKFDLAIILRFDHWWGAFLACLARIPRRVGYDIAEVKPFLTEAVPYVSGRHEVEQDLALVERVAGYRARDAGCQIPDTRDRKEDPRFSLEFLTTAEDEAFAGRYLAERGVEEGDFLVGIHPGAGAAVKLWRNEAWTQVADALAERYGARVILTGSAGERPLVQAIAGQAATRPIVTAGETGLGQLAAVMARCHLVMGVDSGPLHLAVAMGTPTIHLYGPVDWRAFGPWGDPTRHIVIRSDMDCIPCNRLDYDSEEIGEHPCVRSITVDQVLKAVESFLSRGLRGRGLDKNPQLR